MHVVSNRRWRKFGPAAPLLGAALLLALSSGCQQSSSTTTESGTTTTTGEGRRSPALGMGIQFVQLSYATPQSNSTSVTVKYAAAQNLGGLNVVVVGWNDTVSTVTGVTDTSGNVYTLAVGPTTFPGALSQSIYYAKNIAAAAANANSVKVTFNRGAAFADVRILEYAGIDPANALDVVAAASGSATTADSGPATTTNASALIFGANMTTGTTQGPGTGFTSRIITIPDGDIAEDRVVSSTGNYRATVRMDGSPWVMQMVAFRRRALGHPAPHRSAQPHRHRGQQLADQSFLGSGDRQRRRRRVPHRALPRCRLLQLRPDRRARGDRHHLQRREA